MELPSEEKSAECVRKLIEEKNVKENLLFNPGPVSTSDEVKSALVRPDICHRGEEFSSLIKRLNKKMLKVFDANENYSTLFISGSGTSGLESVISTLIPEDEKVLVLSNGAFGERLLEIANVYDLNKEEIKKEWGDLFDFRRIESYLKEEDIFAILVVHHETSVGTLNPIHEIGKLCKKYSSLLIVDSISGLGGEKISMEEDNIDVCVSSPNKCIHSFPGSTIVCINDLVWERTKKSNPGSYYLNLRKYKEYFEERAQTPYTPAVLNLFALEEAVDALLEEGIKNRIEKYRKINQLLRKEISKLGLEIFNEKSPSHSVITVKIPEDKKFKEVYKDMMEEGYVIYPCKPPLKDEYFQIANMGDIAEEDVLSFAESLGESIKC